MNAKIKVSEQRRIAASMGNQVLGTIQKNITYTDKSLIVYLYNAIVRPHLEYCIHAWNPYLRTINVWNKLSTECVHASSVNMFMNKIDKYLVKAGYT